MPNGQDGYALPMSPVIMYQSCHLPSPDMVVDKRVSQWTAASDTDETASNLTGPGRLMDNALGRAGRRIEQWISSASTRAHAATYHSFQPPLASRNHTVLPGDLMNEDKVTRHTARRPSSTISDLLDTYGSSSVPPFPLSSPSCGPDRWALVNLTPAARHPRKLSRGDASTHITVSHCLMRSLIYMQ
jgi:hypothetical protein